ncbi:hypothetical protein [Klenkia soli]|uniref:hypothetical protein n=1 Tax=Klenkia soli TaxID=1052260 RepID=UPI000B826289|nr:hypothetical protein [Klenkia soli]
MSQPPYPPQPSPEQHPRTEHPRTEQQPRVESAYDPAYPPHATEPAYDPAYPPQPTGPMDGAFPAPPPLPGPEVSTSARVGARPRARSTADRATLTSTVLGVLGLLLLVLGLSLGDFGVSLWSATTSWAVFATVAALVALVPYVPGRGGLSRQQAWQVGAVGAGGVVVFWLLVLVLTGAAASDRGFVLTLATALVAGGTWLNRRES